MDEKKRNRATRISGLRNLLQLSPLAIITFDRFFRIRQCNRQAGALFGSAPTEFPGKPFPETILPAGDSQAFREEISGFLHHAPRLYGYHVFYSAGKNKRGNQFAMKLHTFRLDVNNEPLFTTFLSTGDPDRNENHQTLAPEVPVELFKLLGHDVRNALTSIQLLTQIALRHKQSETADHLRNFLTKIDGQSAKLAGLVNDLLDIARIQSGRMTLEKHQVNLREFLGEVQKKAGPAITGPAVTWDRPPALQAGLDPARISQAMLCLLSHGTRSLPGVDRIEVRFHQLASDLQVSLVYRHTEPEPENSAFRGLDRPVPDDTALPDPALFIASEIIRLHGGGAWTERTGNTGTTVHFTLPVRADPTAKLKGIPTRESDPDAR